MKRISLKVKKDKKDLVAEVAMFVPNDFTLRATLWAEDGYTVELDNPNS